MKTLAELDERIKMLELAFDEGTLPKDIMTWQFYSQLCNIKQILTNDKHEMKYDDRIVMFDSWRRAFDWFFLTTTTIPNQSIKST